MFPRRRKKCERHPFVRHTEGESVGSPLRLIDASLEDVPGIGELYVYDTSLRIGAKLNLLPERVYLHAGIRRGARALGLKADKALKVSVLPTEFHSLRPHEIEDVLCIFKKKFKASATITATSDLTNRSWCS